MLRNSRRGEFSDESALNFGVGVRPDRVLSGVESHLNQLLSEEDALFRSFAVDLLFAPSSDREGGLLSVGDDVEFRGFRLSDCGVDTSFRFGFDLSDSVLVVVPQFRHFRLRLVHLTFVGGDSRLSFGEKIRPVGFGDIGEIDEPEKTENRNQPENLRDDDVGILEGDWTQFEFR